MNLDDDNTPEILDDTATEQGHDAPGGEAGEHLENLDKSDSAEEVAFTFEGEDDASEPQADDSPVIRTLREKTREQARRLKELEAKLAPAPDAGPGPKPTLEGCGYDEEEFEKQVLAWGAKKTEADRKAEEAAAKQRQSQQAWADRVTNFEKKAAELVPDFMTTAQTVADHFGDDEAGNIAKAILIYADDPRLIAALKASPAKLAELVALKNDPTALAIAVGELKGKIRTMPRKSAPPPETITKGGAPVAATADKELARLEKEADRTNDRSDVIAYKRKLRLSAG